MRWQKAARLAIAVFIVGFAGFVFLALRKTGPLRARPERLTIDDKAVAQTLGGIRLEARGQVRQGRVLDQVAEPEDSTRTGGTSSATPR